MIRFRHRSGALLLGLATGTVLVGGVAVAAPAEIVPAGWQTALGAEPSATPTVTRPPPRTTAALAAAVPTTTPAPTTTVAPPTTTPPTTTTPPPATTSAPTHTPDAVPVRATRRAPTPSSGPAAAVIAATNEERRAVGCEDLEPDSRLGRAAQGHASDMAENRYFSHSSEDGTRFDDRIRAEGHPSPGGENIAKGQTSAAQVVQEWMDSPPHRRNIENCRFTTIGVGYDDSGDYWVQDFGT